MTPEEKKKYNQKYYEKNREKSISEYQASLEERRKYGREHARKMVDENPEYAKNKNAYRIKWALENPDKIKIYQERNRTYCLAKRIASQNVKVAVREGHLLKPSTCESCGKEKPPREIQGHHEDYSKPKDVRWLCQPCHLVLHRKKS